MDNWWSWHTKSWVHDGVLHSQTAIGVGWALLMALVWLTLLICVTVSIYRDWRRG